MTGKSKINIQDLQKSWWIEYALKAFVTGSRVICSPPVEDTDLDVMLLVDECVAEKLEDALRKDGFRVGGSSGNSGSALQAWPPDEDVKLKNSNVFHSWKKGELNLLLTASEEYYVSFYQATVLAMSLNLTRKRDRVTLFQALTADKWMNYNLRIK